MFALRVVNAQTKTGVLPSKQSTNGPALVASRRAVEAEACAAGDQRVLTTAASRQAGQPVGRDFSTLPNYAVDPPDRLNLGFRRPVPIEAVQRIAIQPKLVVGDVNDPLEREADRVAGLIVGTPVALPPISAAPAQISRARVCEREDEMQRKAVSLTAASADAASAIVSHALARPGRPLDAGTRAFFESRFGKDLGQVRLHDDAVAAESARAVGAHAYTVGNAIAFAKRVDVASEGGRRLLAHELTHTVQQSNRAAARQMQSLQRQVIGATELEAMKDPSCPPEAPFRWGPKKGPGGADPAVVAPCMPTPMPRSRQNLLDPQPSADRSSQKPEAQPSPAPPAATPQQTVPQRPSTPPSATATAAPAASSGATPGAVEGNDSAYDFDDDPLSAGGFGPNDATIRVRPGPVRTTLIRPPAADLRCSYESRRIAAFKGSGPLDVTGLAKDVTEAFTGCDIAYVSIDVVPRANDDDPREHAIERAQSIKRQLMGAIGPGKFTEDRFYTGLSSGGEGEPDVTVWLSGRNKLGSSSEGPNGHGPQGKPAAGHDETEQISEQAGLGDVRHYYTSSAGPNDALHEWLLQMVAAYTKQAHQKNKSGEERQIFAQVQYSLTTRQWTVSFGGQESYVIVLPANLLLSFWAQLMAGENVTSRTEQTSLGVGTQFVWQPADWFSFGLQAGVGPTRQSSGPSSVDRGGLLFFQIQK